MQLPQLQLNPHTPLDSLAPGNPVGEHRPLHVVHPLGTLGSGLLPIASCCPSRLRARRVPPFSRPTRALVPTTALRRLRADGPRGVAAAPAVWADEAWGGPDLVNNRGPPRPPSTRHTGARGEEQRCLAAPVHRLHQHVPLTCASAVIDTDLPRSARAEESSSVTVGVGPPEMPIRDPNCCGCVPRPGVESCATRGICPRDLHRLLPLNVNSWTTLLGVR